MHADFSQTAVRLLRELSIFPKDCAHQIWLVYRAYRWIWVAVMNKGTAIAWNDVNRLDCRFPSVSMQELEREVIRRIDMNPVVLHVNPERGFIDIDRG